MIELADICKSYPMGRGRFAALRRVSLRVAAGDFLAITGPSGSGKTTLMNILGLLDTPDSGRYRLAGQEVAGSRPERLARLRLTKIGFVFQQFQLIARLTALENAALPLSIAGVPAKERRDRAEGLLEQVGLLSHAGHRPAQLSGGQQQRVAIARALALDPPLLLADEPTGNLDRRAGQAVLELLEQLNGQGRTIVLITHDPAVARRAGRQAQLCDGQLTT